MLADRADIADTSAKRRTGLAEAHRLEPGEGLWIVPCEGVHTFGMKFPIDVVFLNRKKKVLKVRPNMVRRPHRSQPARAFGAGIAGGYDRGNGNRGRAINSSSKTMTSRRLPEQLAMLLQDALVHDHFEPGLAGALRGSFMR